MGGLVFALTLALASCGPPRNVCCEDEATCRGMASTGTEAFASCLQKEGLADRYWAAPPPPYWGCGY